MNEEDNVLINHTSDLNGAYCTNGTSVTHTSDGIDESRVVVVVFMGRFSCCRLGLSHLKFLRMEKGVQLMLRLALISSCIT